MVWGATVVRETGAGKWSIENELIRVELRAQTGALSVLDKRIGYLWTQPDAGGPQVPEIAIPQTARPPSVDGDLAEWTALPTFVLTPDMVADALQVDGPEDVSG